MILALDIALSILVLVNTVFHFIGFCLLIRIYRRGLKNTQKIYIINMSIFEALQNLMSNLQRIPEMISHKREISKWLEYIQHYATLLNLTGIWIVLYFTMIFITIDRFLVVWLGFRYSIYWTKKKALYLVNITWAICLSFSISVAMGEAFLHFHYQDLFYVYFYPTMDFLYMVIVVTAYVYIFYRYQKSFKLEHKKSRKTIRQRRPSTTQQAFSQSRFYTTILLVSTFLIFIVIPDLIYMFFGPKISNRLHHERPHGYKSNILFDVCRFSYAIASSLNFFIYIFLQLPVRRLIRSKREQLKRYITKGSIINRINLDTPIELHTLTERRGTQASTFC